MFIDTHAHLGMLKHAPIQEILERAKEQKITEMVTVSVDEDSWAVNEKIANSAHNIFYTLGLHPHEAMDWEKGRGTFEALFQNGIPKKCVAIGEIGLDYYYEHSPKAIQIPAFEAQYEHAKKHDLPVVIHCREAFPDLFASIKNCGLSSKPGVMHCFTGTYEEAKASVDLGFYISFSGILTFKNSSALRETAGKLPLDRIVIETDCPFLTPIPHRGKPNEPAFLTQTARVLAELHRLVETRIGEITTRNAKALFGLV